MVREKTKAMRAHVAKMSELFHDADTSGDGKVDYEETCDCETQSSGLGFRV